MRPTLEGHCRTLGIAGSGLLARLGAELPLRLLGDRGPSPLAIAGPPGSGRTLTAKLCHRVGAHVLGRDGELVTIDCGGSPSLLERAPARSGLLALAGRGTLVLDGVERLSNESQSRLAELLQRFDAEHSAAVAEDPLLVMLLGDAPAALAATGRLDRHLADVAPSPLQLEPLFARGPEIQELAGQFLRDCAAELCPGRTLQFTRRALSDLRQAVEGSRIGSVTRLRDVVCETVQGGLATGELPDRIPSEWLLPLVGGTSPAELALDQARRDLAELSTQLPSLVDAALLDELARRHKLSRATLEELCRVMDTLLAGEEPGSRLSYPQIIERSKVVSKVALWLVSGARTQADFRHFFGEQPWQMPTKSVAWAVFHDVIGGADGADA